MTIFKRVLRKRTESPVIDFPNLDVETALTPPQISKTPEPPDPVKAAMKRLLAHSLAVSGIAIDEAARDGVVTVVLLPTDAWAEAAAGEWNTAARNGLDFEDGFRDRHWQRSNWVCWSPRALEREYTLNDAAENFARAVSAGRHCAAFTPDLNWLPHDLVQGADYHLVLPPLTSADVLAVAQDVCGDEPRETFSDEQAAALTPRLLRLGRRPAQSADAYLRKLRDLLDLNRRAAVQAAQTSSISIREAPTLERLHGMAEAVAWGLNLAKEIQLFREGKIAWSDVDRGLLLSGPTGCGKTLYARGLATTCGVPLVAGAYGEWLGTGNGHQGDLLKAMKKTFAAAREQAPSLLFIDEVDSFPNRATISHRFADWEVQVVNALLAQIDGVEDREGVVLVAACNFPEKLDLALIRSGRLDRHIRIDLPDRSALAAILREHLGNELPGDNLLAPALAGAGSSGADCERFVRGARRRARNAGRALTLDDLMKEIGGEDDRTDAEWCIAAVHEAGHAVSMCELQPGSLRAVTLTGNGDSGGRTQGGLLRTYISAADVHHRLVVTLAGRAAEEVILKMPSSAAGGGDDSDLAQATRLAAAAATSLGLDATTGLLWLGEPDAASLLGLLRDQPALAARVRTVVDEAYTEALTLIRRRALAVKALAAALLEKRALDGNEAAAIVARYPAGAATGVSL